MKEFIVSIYGGLLQVGVVLVTLIGFTISYNAGFSTSFVRGLVGAGLAFVFAAIISGYLFTQIRMKELLEEQVYYLQESEKRAKQP